MVFPRREGPGNSAGSPGLGAGKGNSLLRLGREERQGRVGVAQERSRVLARPPPARRLPSPESRQGIRKTGGAAPAARPSRVPTPPRGPGWGDVCGGWSGKRPRPTPRPGPRRPKPGCGARGAASFSALPRLRTCTARLRKVPASAASFFTLKSMMFMLGDNRALRPADLAGRRLRGGGEGRRGPRRKAAPAPPPQLLFP